MTDVNGTKKNLINTIADALPLYAPPPVGFYGKVGLEVEMALYKTGLDKPVIPPATTMLKLQSDLKAKGYDAQLEAAGVLEYASSAVDVGNVASLLPQIKLELADFENAAKAEGYSRAPYCIMPTTTLSDAFNNMVTRERLVTAISAMKETFPDVSMNVPMLTTGVQTSFSPKDQDEMFRMVGRAYALTPLLIAAMNSASGFVRNEPERNDIHFRAKYYESYGSAGGIAESFLNATNGAELVQNHIAAVFKTPMHFGYGEEGLIQSTKNNVVTFEKLKEMGLNNQSNYELAETFIYNDVKICNLRDGDGNVMGKRIEVRAADSGLHQPISSLLLTTALIPDGKTADAFDALLKDYGFTGVPRVDADLLKLSRQAAVEHHGKFMDVAFGTGRMRDFAADVAVLIASHYEGQGIARDTARLLDVLRNGNCDAQVFAKQTPTLQDVTASLQAAGQDNKPLPNAAVFRRKLG